MKNFLNNLSLLITMMKESYYNFIQLFKKLPFLDEYDITYEVIDYEPWKKCLSMGIQIVGIRK